MPIQEDVKYSFKGDASGLKAASNQAKAILTDVENTAESTGRKSGDKLGREMAKAQDRWMKVIQQGLRQYFGAIGGMAANALEMLDKVGKAREATRNVAELTHTGKSTVQREIVQESGGLLADVAATGGAAATGAHVGNRTGNNNIEQRAKAIEDSLKKDKVGGNLARSAAATLAAGEAGKNVPSIKVKPELLDFEKSQILNWAKKQAPMFTKAFSFLGGLIPRAILTPILGGIGAIIAGIGAAIVPFAIGARGADKDEEMAKKMASIRQLREEIEAIQDPTQKTQAILKELGADGQAEYRKLTEELNKYNQEQANTGENIRTFQILSKAVMETLGDGVTAVGNGFKWALDKAAGFFNFLAGVSDNDISKELADGIVDTAAQAERLQKKLDAKKAERATKAEKDKEAATKKAEKDAEEAQKLAEQYTKELEESNYEQASLADKIAITANEQRKLADAISKAKKDTKEHNQLLLDQLKLSERMVELEKEKNREAVAKGDRGRLSLAELASMEGKTEAQNKNINKAKEVQRLEKEAELAMAGNDRINADKFRKQAEKLRTELGMAGILRSEDYTVEKQQFSNNKSVSIGEMLAKNPDLTDDYQRLNALEEHRKALENYIKNVQNNGGDAPRSEALLKSVKDKIAAQQATIKDTLEKRRSDDPLTRMAQDYARDGALHVIPHNGK